MTIFDSLRYPVTDSGIPLGRWMIDHEYDAIPAEIRTKFWLNVRTVVGDRHEGTHSSHRDYMRRLIREWEGST